MVVCQEAVAVEADEADFGADPEEAVGSLGKGLDGVLGEAVFHDPGLAAIAGEWSAGLEGACAGRTCGEDQREGNKEAAHR